MARSSFDELAERVLASAQGLDYKVFRGSENVLSEVALPVQDGLDFVVVLQKQQDLLCLGCGELLWMEYPDTLEGAAELEEAARCILSGDCRIVERSRRGHVVTAMLEKLQEGKWVRVSEHHKLHLPCGVRETRVLRRGPCGGG